MASGLLSALCAGVPDQKVEDFPREIRALALDQVRAEAGRSWRAADLSVVVVGDRAKVVPEIEKLGLGKVVELTVE